MNNYRKLGDLLGAKGYIRGPFGSALVRKELRETGVYAVYEQAQAISGSRSFRYFINQEKFEELRRFRVQSGDLLISCSGTVGRVSIVMDDDPDGIISQALLILRPQTGEIIPEYLRWFFSTREGKNALTNASHGSVQVNIAPRATVESIEIPTPDLRTQQAIAHILGTLDDKIELNQKMNQTLEEIAKAIFKSWFVDFDPVRAKADGRPTGLPPEISDLFPDELVDSEIGEIPKGWSPSVAGDLFDCLDRKRIPLSGNDRAKRQGSIPYYGATGIIDHVDDHIFDGTYLLIGEDGSVEKEDGTAFSQYVSGKIWVNNHAHVLIGKGSISTEFLYLAFQFVKVSPFVTGAVQLKISQTNLRSIPITSSPTEISVEFQKIIAPMFERRLLLEKENLCLAELRDTLLPKLISGELRIPDAEKFLKEAGI
jgi:type I restriction enzyme S subunit